MQHLCQIQGYTSKMSLICNLRVECKGDARDMTLEMKTLKSVLILGKDDITEGIQHGDTIIPVDIGHTQIVISVARDLGVVGHDMVQDLDAEEIVIQGTDALIPQVLGQAHPVVPLQVMEVGEIAEDAVEVIGVMDALQYILVVVVIGGAIVIIIDVDMDRRRHQHPQMMDQGVLHPGKCQK